MIGIIHIAQHFAPLIEELVLGYEEQYVEVFEREDFKIDDAKEVIAQSYLTREKQSLIILAANKYNHAAQNALLKIIEEPPSKIQFILIAKNKNALLPTIRSRMRIITHKSNLELPPFALNVKKLSLQEIYHFCKQNEGKAPSKEETKLQIESLLFALNEAEIKLTHRELSLFDTAIKLNQNDATEKHNYIFLPLLLRIYQKQKSLQ
ncbi:DNA polymerase III subunit delta' [Helicobacter cinaedi CCUG 18818 = ATCC BAA-847]|uniref:DNA polymerase III subunit delta n=1 Tax=Helicobacter cinaedi CCUG 18818 = ATCC BAA-847 TaxID=537971 RepID=A0AAI8MLP1_9HELI|nr:DNA polymerase III subunit delta' [Helicobacter cinaedi]EFR47357.1 DNA polymerase III, delta' subunit [Helicobacter cinaedi CCUG 18818 = ATCC BAA-847]BAM31531.1 DNA polymerase III subunit delta' [Helicobacter cinaedi CCUG 18818 = ATCC BAA-847]